MPVAAATLKVTAVTVVASETEPTPATAEAPTAAELDATTPVAADPTPVEARAEPPTPPDAPDVPTPPAGARPLAWTTPLGSKSASCASHAAGPAIMRRRPSEMLRNERTTVGSNWVPAHTASSARADAGDIGCL